MLTQRGGLPHSWRDALLHILKERFTRHKERHPDIAWKDVEHALQHHEQAMVSLYQMEQTGGEPDITGYDDHSRALVFTDCSAESPSGRRSLCYDDQALQKRKTAKPSGSACAMAAAMGIELLTWEEYLILQQLGPVDTRTSSWLKTPASIRSRGGAIFGDCHYGQVFMYHNSAGSYYAARGFRGKLLVSLL
jgi:hypothetical protein